jgi:hypothetical protein
MTSTSSSQVVRQRFQAHWKIIQAILLEGHARCSVVRVKQRLKLQHAQVVAEGQHGLVPTRTNKRGFTSSVPLHLGESARSYFTPSLS